MSTFTFYFESNFYRPLLFIFSERETIMKNRNLVETRKLKNNNNNNNNNNNKRISINVT